MILFETNISFYFMKELDKQFLFYVPGMKILFKIQSRRIKAFGQAKKLYTLHFTKSLIYQAVEIRSKVFFRYLA